MLDELMLSAAGSSRPSRMRRVCSQTCFVVLVGACASNHPAQGHDRAGAAATAGVTSGSAGFAGIVSTNPAGSGGIAAPMAGRAGATAGSSAAGHAANGGAGAGAAASGGSGGQADEDAGQLGVCGGSADPNAALPGCNTVQDCPKTSALPQVCAEDRPPVMGGAAPPRCEPTSCPSDQICSVVGFMIECVIACDKAGAPSCAGGRCAPGDRFADARGCAPPLCSDSPTTLCGATSDCDPNSDNRDANGCVLKSCTTSADCPCGTCAAGRCYERPLHCFEMIFAP